MDKIALASTSKWLTGRDPNMAAAVSNIMALADKDVMMPIFTLYNIPHRDCGNFSGGGAATAEEYTDWVTAIASAISNRKALIILEPDSLAGLDCPTLTSAQKAERIGLIRSSVLTLKSLTGSVIYLDGGHSAWQSAATMISILKQAGITNADGFCLNVSNFQRLEPDLIKYGEAISKGLRDAHFIIDTSRNGLGPAQNADGLAWCNPAGRALGKRPTCLTSHPLIDAFLWVKVPGESDGSCRANEPAAGVFWPEYALGLAQRAAY
jgi:endoglucanase